jgi:hypothetical protein
MNRVDARVYLQGLVGQKVETYSGRPNHVLGIEGDSVLVGTERSPKGKSVPIPWIQDALDRLMLERHVEVSVDSLGYRSAFVAGVLLTLPGTRKATNPARVVLGE